jgi:ribosome-interacting GTPase 1
MISDFFENGSGVGKTRLLKTLTNVNEGISGIFTAEPIKGIYEWDRTKIQLVEEPALHPSQYLSKVLSTLRTTDIILLTIDLSKDPLIQMENILSILKSGNIFLNRPPPPIKWERTGSGGIQLFFLTKSAKECEDLSDFIREIAHEAGCNNAIIKIKDKITESDIGVAFDRSSVFQTGVILATKADIPGSKQNFLLLSEKFGKIKNGTPEENNEKFEILPAAIKVNEENKEICQGLDNFAQIILNELDFIRVYTKSKKGIADRPLIVPRSSTIGDIARKIHKEMYNNFKFAYIYRLVGPQRKIRAGLTFQVDENDVIEIFTTI